MKSWCCTYDTAQAPGGEGGGGSAGTTATTCGVREAKTEPPDRGLVWCHLDGRDAAEKAWLEQQSGLPHAVVVALLAIETRPRSDLIGGGAIINLRGLRRDGDPGDDGDELVSIRLYADRNRVISVSYRTLAAVKPVHERMEKGEIRDPGDLITAIAIEVTRALDPKIADLGDEVDSCETALDAEQAFTMRRTIARVRSTSIGYRRFVTPQRQALERLAGLEVDWLDQDDRLHLREAADRFARMGEELEAVRERSALMHEQLTDLRAEQIETRTLLLAVVALIFLPLTFITGLFGMNFDHIPFQHSAYGFEWTVAASVAVAAAITLYFWKAHWFRR